MASLVTTQALGMIGATTILGRKNQLKDQLLITVMVGLAGMMPKMMDLIISTGVHLIIKLLVIMESQMQPRQEQAFSEVCKLRNIPGEI